MAQMEFTQIFPKPGWVEHDPMEIWSSQIAVAAKAMGKIGVTEKNIAAIGITNQRERRQPESRYTMRSFGSAAGLQKKWRNW